MTEGAKLAGVDFILNVVMNSKGKIVRAFAGDLEEAFNEAVKLVDELYRVIVDRRADIVVVSAGGHPGDIDLYQAYKGLDNALEVVKRNGVVVLVAECPEGHGHQVFYEWMIRFGDLKKVEREVKRHFIMGGHKAYYLLKALKNHTIILVSSLPDYYASDVFKFKTSKAVNDAFKEALKISGSSSKVWVIPHGNHTLPIVKTQK
jgi:nickel-dependent lactate racemase